MSDHVPYGAQPSQYNPQALTSNGFGGQMPNGGMGNAQQFGLGAIPMTSMSFGGMLDLFGFAMIPPYPLMTYVVLLQQPQNSIQSIPKGTYGPPIVDPPTLGSPYQPTLGPAVASPPIVGPPVYTPTTPQPSNGYGMNYHNHNHPYAPTESHEGPMGGSF